MTRFSIAALVLFSAGAVAHAGKVKVWYHADAAHFEKAQFHGAVVSSDGTVRLARELRPLTDLDASHAWGVIEDAGGNLFVAGSGGGRLYRLTPTGELTIINQGSDAEVLCLALGADGAVYAGTGPQGRILRVGAEGKATIFCQTPESYVWSLTPGWGGELYAGTGPRGRVYRIDPRGQASVF